MDEPAKNSSGDSNPQEEKNKTLKGQERYTPHHFILAKYVLYIFAAFMLILLLWIPIVPLVVPGMGDDKCENFEIIKFFATFMGPILMAVLGYYFGQKGVEEATSGKKKAIGILMNDRGMKKDEEASAVIKELREENENLRKYIIETLNNK